MSYVGGTQLVGVTGVPTHFFKKTFPASKLPAGTFNCLLVPLTIAVISKGTIALELVFTYTDAVEPAAPKVLNCKSKIEIQSVMVRPIALGSAHCTPNFPLATLSVLKLPCVKPASVGFTLLYCS